MSEAIGVVINDNYDYDIVRLLEACIGTNIYCFFITSNTFIEHVGANIIAMSYDNYKTYACYISKLFLEENIDEKIKKEIIATTNIACVIMYFGKNLQLNISNCYDTTSNLATSILILNMSSGNMSALAQHFCTCELKKEYNVSVLSSNKYLQIFGYNFLNYNMLINSNISSSDIRSELRKIVNNICYNNDIIIYDYPYSIGAPDILVDECVDILFRDLIAAVPPDYVIFVLPLNRSNDEYISQVKLYMQKIYNIDLDSIVIGNEIFDEVCYVNSKFKIIKTIPSTKNGKNNMARTFNSKYFNLEENSTWKEVLNDIESKLGEQIHYMLI